MILQATPVFTYSNLMTQTRQHTHMQQVVCTLLKH